MPLIHPKDPRVGNGTCRWIPVFVGEGLKPVPRNEMPADGIDPDLAYQIVHDELLLDGNARLNLATFVSTWMEPQAQKLYAETYDKNMIDKDEYPQTAELEMRCVNMLAHLFHSPDVSRPPDAPRPVRARRHARGARPQAALAAQTEEPGKAASTDRTW